MRKLALIRDKYTCQCCGRIKKDGEFNPPVHHIIPFDYYGTLRYLEANNLNNLKTLCLTCHPDEEWEFRRMVKALRLIPEDFVGYFG